MVSLPVPHPRVGPDPKLPTGLVTFESQCLLPGCFANCDILLVLLGTHTFQIWTRSFADLAIDDFSLWQWPWYCAGNGQTLRSRAVCPLLDSTIWGSTLD